MEGFLAKFDERFERMNRMAETLGTDLVQAVSDRRIGGTGLCDAVFACADCGRTADCSRWLLEHATGAESPPDFCCNVALYERLVAGRRP